MDNANRAYKLFVNGARISERKYLKSVSSTSSITRRYNSSIIRDGRPFRMAVLGSGPAGFYTAYKVMSLIQNSVVDMYEHLPVPFGLVRYGVAPDHPEVKHCQEKFEEVASSPRFHFIGNIEIGKGIPLASIQDHYDAIVFAYGATKDRKLGIPGEKNLRGVYSARDFVGWYNGLPEHASLVPDLESGEEAIIIGQGNVALDVARILLSNLDRLKSTDMADYALQTLSRSRVKRVRIVGRRGPMQAAFTIKEVRELFNLPALAFQPIPQSLLPSDPIKLPRTAKRLAQLLSKGSPNTTPEADKLWSLDFLRSPKSFNSITGSSHRLASVTFHQNIFADLDTLSPSAAIITDRVTETYPASLAFRSIGYRSENLVGMEDLGIKFDERQGIIPNDSQGRVTGSSPDVTGMARIPGLYCSGWVKRGPAGVIANTMEDAFATAEAIAKDWQSGQPFLDGGQGWDTVKIEAGQRGLRSVDWDSWKKIDAAERRRGMAKGKEREKFATVQEMLHVID